VQTNRAAAQARWEADPDGARNAVDRARNTARDAMSEMVALLDRLRQDPVESIGLVEALRRQAEALGYQTGAVVTTEFDGLPAPERLAPGAMTAIFRVAQEAMANISRHARPAHVCVTATSLDDRFVITIRDDGRGFPLLAPAPGMGLSNMRSRAAELGARLSIEAAEGAGCEVVLSVPLIDPARVNRKQLERRLLAVVPPLAVLTLLAMLSPGFWMYTWPLLAGGITFAAAQAWPLLRLR
jgi:signal transduction histidine kinase